MASTETPSSRRTMPDVEQLASKLLDKSTDVKASLATAFELKDLLDLFQNLDYALFLKHVVPAFVAVLESTPCSFVADAPEQRLRHIVLETTHRLPQQEVLKPYADTLMTAMLNVLRDDNEDNAVLALKVIIDLHRSFKAVLQDQVQPFLELVKKLYTNMKNTVEQAFESEASQLQGPAALAASTTSDASPAPTIAASTSEAASAQPTSAPTASAATSSASAATDATSSASATPAAANASESASTEAAASTTSTGTPSAAPSTSTPTASSAVTPASTATTISGSKVLPKSMSSFKVLTECPIVIVLIFQSYRAVVAQAINVFVPLIIESCLSLQAKPQREAHEAAKAKGEIFVGVAPGIKNRSLYTDMIVAQVKTMSFLAYVLRGSAPVMRPFAQVLPEISVRLLKDCPPEASATRKELLVATRHVLSTEYRAHFVGQIDTLLDERVLIGTGVTSHETQRPLAISMLADLVHHVRQELSPAQLVRVVHIHSQILHDPTLAPSIQTMCVKLLLNLVETILTKHPEGATQTLASILDVFVEKLSSLHRLRSDMERMKHLKDQSDEAAGETEVDAVAIERGKPIQAAATMLDTAGDPLKDARFLFRNILFGFKTLIPVLRHRNAAHPDGALAGKLLVDGVKCWSLHEDRDGREEKEVLDLFTTVFIDLEPQVFHEVFTTHMPFLFGEMLNSPTLLGIPQNLLSNDAVSKRFVGILLRFLADRLEELGKSDKKHASISLRLFKMAFMAVTIFPEENEVVLQPHLSHLIMESMKLASKADEPTNYFLLLRALFRSIGGGRFELLYKDVLPLLPVLLENLNALLNAAEPSGREVFVDLCLTVPVRLSVLLPYLGYLMKPLVLALQSSTELVSQGLRTLELCIDNLTQEFLDPIMAPYAQDIMAALWQHLRPLPHNHQHSHTTMRILGKMGGRNRKLLQNPPRLSYVSHKAPTFPVHFEGKVQSMTLTPFTELALANIRRTDPYYRKHAFELLRHTAALFLDGSLMDADRETVFGRLIKGLFDATRSDDLRDDAVQYLFGICKHVFHAEIRREMPSTSGGSSRHLWPMTTSLLEGLTHALALNEAGNDPAPLIELQLQIIRDFLTACETAPATRPDLGHIVMHSFASKFCSQCYEELWQRKTGGWLGVDMLVRRADLGQIWVRDHQLEIVRALLFMLKDMPNDPPGNIDEVSETLLQVIRQAYTVKAPAADGKSEPPVPERPSHLTYLIGILVPELSSSNATVRTTTQTAFKLLAELRKCTVTELLTPQKDRLLQPIFTKPLRALPFGMQIGHIDAITFALNLTPPLPEFNEELYRVLTEALALADADDQALIGRTSQYKNMIAVTKLRVVAIRLLSSAMACGDFLSAKHTQMRMKIISVYFKSLYSRSEEVVQVAYESLKTVLSQQSKLPKDLLQSGLRPILMTLADRNRLTASGLEGLARLLQLLTNYFKVEIGTKLLDHLTSLAEPAVLHRAAVGSLRDNEQIKTLVAIVNVFRLLPEASFQFLPRLTTTVAEIESQLRRAGPTPFTKPLTLFLNRFAEKAVTYFFEGDKLSNPKFLRVVKLSLASDDGPELRTQVTKEREKLLFPLFADEASAAQVQAGVTIVRQLVERDPEWLVTNKNTFEKLIALWNSPASSQRRREEANSGATKAVAPSAPAASPTSPVIARSSSETKQIIELFLSYLRVEPHVEAYIALLDAYTYKIAFDLTFATRFVYEHLCIKSSNAFKRQMFSRFLTLFEDKDASQTLKTQALRVLINPMLMASYGPHPASTSTASPKSATSAVAETSAAKSASPVQKPGNQDGDVDMKDAATDDKKPAATAAVESTGTATTGAPASAPAAATAATETSAEASKPAEPKDTAAASAQTVVADDGEVIDAELVTQIVNRMWKPFQNPKDASELCSDDALRIELLHMSTMILEHCSDHLAPNGQLKKDTIKFGWANLTAEDVTVKNVAYIFIARFLEVFESPIKIVGQVYFGLLRAHQSEGRSMVKKALDILVPALPKRAGASENGQPPQWAKWTKRQLVDEGHNVSQLFAILSLLVRHPDLFYSSREMFIPHIVSNLTKLGLVANVNVESRMLAVDLVELLHKWEKRREEHVRSQESSNGSSSADGTTEGEAAAAVGAKRGLDPTEEGSTVKKVRIDETGISASASKSASPASAPATSTNSSAAGTAAAASADEVALSPADHRYLMPMNLREMTVGFLVRFVSLSMEPISKAGIVSKAANLLSEILKAPYWSDVQVRLSIFQRPLIHTEINEQNTPVICNALRTLQIVVQDKTDAYIAPHVPQLQKLLEKSASTDEVSLVEAQKPVLERIFRVIPDPPPEEDADGEAEMDTGDDKKPDEEDASATKDAKDSEATDELAVFRKFADTLIADGLKQSQHLYSVFSMLDAWSQSKPEKIDAHLPALSKALSKLTKEHLAAAAPVPASDPNLKLLMLVLELLKRRISNLGDQRRWLLSALVQLVERSSSLELCRFLLSTMSKWILEQRETFPTVKEKAGILLKMMSFESRENDQLLRDYLDLIHAIYTTPAFARTELTVRLENAFLLGCRHKDAEVRQKFIDIFDRTLVRGVAGRLQYLLGHQSWEYLAEHYWISQVLDLMLGSVDTNWPLLTHTSVQLGKGGSSFVPTLKSLQVGDMIGSIRALLYTDRELAHQIWTSFFAAAWRSISRKDHDEITRALIGVLTREYNLRQVSKRPNVVQTLLEGALACKPQLELPPHVVKYLGRNFNAWHTSIELLQNLLRSLPRQDDAIREAGQDALTELYAELSEEDMFYGLWRRRCVYAETNSAISFEQVGMWNQAQVQYETAQIKARSGVLNFTEAEYHLWEDQWVFCAQKLQQWDILTDLAKMEGDNDLLLECAWRLYDWNTERETLEQALESLSASATPRRRVFEAYMALLKSQSGQDKPAEFGRICDEAIQLTLKKWHSLPTAVTVAHVPLLQIFQQFVELQEASTIFASLAHTNATNLDQRSAELKAQMQTWRERLPNLWDDINAWSDLVAWRQHVFGAINKAYLPLVPVIQQRDGQNASTNSYAYRGYHETAWIINRFAHVARKHYLNDVCISSLTKIYTLPNIEIQEAFLKLREQAKCHFQNPNELTQGLDVINNTNLMFFAAPQKAEFFTLKGMFMARLGLNDEANHAFATAIQMDLNLAKAWTEWGRYNDRLFRDRPNDLSAAGNAVSCYLQAAGLYKNAKVRKVLIRVLWLLSCDDNKGTVWQAFEGFKGDAPIWYWITFIPQLLQSLSHKEARFARKMLMSIAKTFPQSLYFYLRTTKEDFVAMKRQSMMAAQRAAQQQARQQQAAAAAAAAAAANGKPAADASKTAGTDAQAAGSPAKADGATPAAGSTPASGTEAGANKAGAAGTPAAAGAQAAPGAPAAPIPAAAAAAANVPRQPWEYVDEILNILKTAFPLLTLTMENIAEQIQQRFKPTNEEDIYRLTNALLNDALQQYIQRAVSPNDSGVLPASSQANVIRFAENLPPGPLKTSFEEDFVKSKPTLRDYVSKLQRWRDRYETSLDRRPSKQHLEHCSHYLVEFQHQKFDEVEVPGQYLKLEDNNSDFVKIARFMPVFEMVRSSGMCTRRLTILSNKGTTHSFAVQLPSGRYCRREERIFQLLRFFNRILERRKETRKRGLAFHVPLALPLAPQVRLIDHDSSFVSLQDIYERHCEEIGIGKDDPVIAWVEKMRSTWDGGSAGPHAAASGAGGGAGAAALPTRGNVDFTNLRMDLMEEISTKYVADTVLSRYLTRSMSSASELYMLRKQFTLQTAASSFVTYCLFVSNRLPNRIHISRTSGQVAMSDVVPTFNPTAPQFKSTDPTPFRLSPNLQNFIGPVGIEGVLTSALMALGRTLTEPERNLEEYLGIFVRDEINFWLQGAHRQAQAQAQAQGIAPPASTLVSEAPKEVVLTNVLEIVKRAKLISCRHELDKLHANSTPNPPLAPQSTTTPVSSVVLDLINSASNPSKLALQDPTWAPWL